MLGRIKRPSIGKFYEKATYEDVEGLIGIIGVMFALAVPSAMVLQNIGYDDGVQEKNFIGLLCLESGFRQFVLQIMVDPGWGNIGSYEFELLNMNVPMGGGNFLNMTNVLLRDSSFWQWDGDGPESIHTCGAVPEIAVVSNTLWEYFPQYMMRNWALYNPDSVLWSDHQAAKSAFAMAILIAGLLGTVVLYISLSLTPARTDEKILKRWMQVGYPCLMGQFLSLLGGIIVLLFANDGYSESQDSFWLRSGRMGGYQKIALLAVFVPIVLVCIILSAMALYMSCTSPEKASKVAEAEQAGDSKIHMIAPHVQNEQTTGPLAITPRPGWND